MTPALRAWPVVAGLLLVASAALATTSTVALTVEGMT